MITLPQPTIELSWGPSATPSSAFGGNVKQGDLLIVGFFPNSATPTALPTDSVGTGYALLASIVNATVGNGYIYVGVAPASGPNTVQFALSASDSGATFLTEAMGAANAVDGVLANIFNLVAVPTTNPTSNSLVTTNAGDLLLNYIVSQNGGLSAGQAGWTKVNGSFKGSQYLIPGVTGTYQPGWTQTSGEAICALVAFLPALITTVNVLAFLPSGFPENNPIRVGEDNYDSISQSSSYTYDKFGPRPGLQPIF